MSEQAPERRSDAWFMLVCAVLVFMIIAALFWLWRRERTARLEAQRIMQQSQQPVLPPALEELFRSGGKALVAPLDREALSSRPIQIDGHAVDALQVSAEAGQRIGLKPGDVLIVEQQASTAPATQIR